MLKGRFYISDNYSYICEAWVVSSCTKSFILQNLSQEFLKKMKASEEGQTYITKYRKKMNDEKLFNEVKTTLPHLFK